MLWDAQSFLVRTGLPEALLYLLYSGSSLYYVFPMLVGAWICLFVWVIVPKRLPDWNAIWRPDVCFCYVSFLRSYAGYRSQERVVRASGTCFTWVHNLSVTNQAYIHAHCFGHLYTVSHALVHHVHEIVLWIIYFIYVRLLMTHVLLWN